MNGMKEVSVIVPCFLGYNENMVAHIYEHLLKTFDKFELVLCTSSKFKGVRQSNIFLTDLGCAVKCYFTHKSSRYDVVKCGVENCVYNNVILLNLEDFFDDDVELFSSLKSSFDTSRFNAYYSDSMIALNEYDLRVIFGVCRDFSLTEIFNVCDFLNYRIFNIRNGKQIRLKDLNLSNSTMRKFAKERRTKRYDVELCQYMRERNLMVV